MSAVFGARASARFNVRVRESVGTIRARSAWRALKRRERRAPIPTGLRPKAQGCEERATLGERVVDIFQPQRGCGTISYGGHNLVEVEESWRRFPKVTRSSQPWAGGHCPVGANESRTLSTLRDTLLPKLLSGELRLPSQDFGTAGVKQAEKQIEAAV